MTRTEASTPSASGHAPPLTAAAGHLPFLAVVAAAVGYRILASAPSAAGLLTAVAVYLLMARWGVWRWLATLATVPALLSPPLVTGEDRAGSAGLVVLLLSVALLWAGWRARPHPGPVLVTALLLTAVPAVLTVTASRLAGPGADDLLLSSPAWEATLLAGLLLCTAAVLGVARARTSPMRAVCALTGLPPLAALIATAPADGAHSWVVGASALAWWPAAGALGLTALLRGRRAAGARAAQADAVDRDALDAFDQTYGEPRLAPVVVVIAAYNEARGLPAVLAAMPETVCGLPLDVLVVDDGSTDDTAGAVAGDDRARVVSCSVNRGQGAALRLGYRLAREHAAQYILTTDADGQYDTADLPVVLAPVVEGRADFVTGSRRLGRQHTHDRVRRLGVHVFAWLVSALVGRYVTDTSFGLRAMRAEVTAAVTLRQPQYQSSELMIGVFSHGFRVLEVPATMHLRSAGSSKKGRNLVYGARYAKVVLGTWWREGCPSPVAERAAALRGCLDHAALP